MLPTSCSSAREPHALDRGLVESHLGRDHLAVARDGLRVTRGARVAHVERLRQRQHGRELLVAPAVAPVRRRQHSRRPPCCR